MSVLEVWLATFGISVVSAIVPLVNAELYVLGASAAAPPRFVVPLVVAATVGQMVGKAAMYYAGRGALRIPGERMRRHIAQAQARLETRRGIGGAMVFLSAAVSLPPFYIVSIACGMLRFPFGAFFLLGLCGRLLRFAALVAGPQLMKGL